MDDRKIIGGEFRIDSDVLKMNMNNYSLPKYSLGRTCLYAILSALKSKVGGVLLPDYLCSSVVEVPLRLCIPIKHYHVDVNSLLPYVPDIKDELNKGDTLAIILISYFGIVNLDDVINSIISNYSNSVIIIDDVQNFYGFGKHIDYDYCFTSYRKWFAVPDGADVLQKNITTNIEEYSLRDSYANYKVAGNLLKNHIDMIGDAISLELIDKGEKLMDKEYCFRCSEIGAELFGRVDKELVAEKRKRNGNILHIGLERLGIKHFYNYDRIPLFIPIIIDDRNRIRSALFSEKIFVPYHWPNKDKKVQGDNELYETELSLICDQRYDEEDMERILRGIENAM